MAVLSISWKATDYMHSDDSQGCGHVVHTSLDKVVELSKTAMSMDNIEWVWPKNFLTVPIFLSQRLATIYSTTLVNNSVLGLV